MRNKSYWDKEIAKNEQDEIFKGMNRQNSNIQTVIKYWSSIKSISKMLRKRKISKKFGENFTKKCCRQEEIFRDNEEENPQKC